MITINAELLTIGDELLYGQIVDTNAQWMSVAIEQCWNQGDPEDYRR